MGIFRKKETRNYAELRDDTVAAYEESTGKLPNDYQLAEIQIRVKDYLDEERKKK